MIVNTNHRIGLTRIGAHGPIKSQIKLRFLFVFLLWGSLLSCSEQPHKMDSTESMQERKELDISLRQRATITGDVLEVESIIRNISQRDLVLMPSLLYVQLADNRHLALRHDVVAVELTGVIAARKSDGMGEVMMGFDKRYRLQFVSFPQEATLTLIYRIPITSGPTMSFRRIEYLLPIKIPVWTLKSLTVLGLESKIQSLDSILLDQENVPDSSVHFFDPHIVNIGSIDWLGVVACDSLLFREIAKSKLGWVSDSTIRQVVVSR